MSIPTRALLSTVLSLLVASCGGGGGNQPPAGQQPAAGGSYAAALSNLDVPTDKNAYPALPDPDAGADPAVPAEQGGRGFTGQGWQTNVDFDLIGDPRAVKGGAIRQSMADFPGTLRLYGPNTTEFGQLAESFVYEGLLTTHPTTLDWIPALATHWQISNDRLTFRYRLNPNARWSDDKPVVADDVVATFDLMMDKTLQDPSAQLVFEKFTRPVAESKYIVRVSSKQLNWRNFLYFSGMAIYPAHVLKGLGGARYIKEYNDKMFPGTGPYIINANGIQKGNQITFTRRPNYWAEKHRRNVGVSNFDQVHEVVVRDDKLAFEMFKKGDLDYAYMNISRQWVEEMNFDRVQRGMIQKRKIFNDYPQGLQAMAFNTRRDAWKDIRVRQALTYLFNRKLLIERIFFNEYFPKQSFYFGAYANPNNPKNEYDPKTALSLLAEAGWKDRDAQGRLVKDGKPLVVELLYGQQGFEPVFTIYQEDLRKVGIQLNLRLVTFETMIQLIDARNFDLVSLGYTGLLYPNPETQFQSSLADQDNNNNITAVKSPRIDQLLKDYDVEFDQKKREAMIQEIDGIVANLHHFILEWDAPFFRVAYWNKFGHPDYFLTRVGNYRDPLSLWWVDPQKEKALGDAMRDSSRNLPVGETEVKYWREYASRQTAPAAGSQTTQ